jgi:hypothetical protein
MEDNGTGGFNKNPAGALNWWFNFSSWSKGGQKIANKNEARPGMIAIFDRGPPGTKDYEGHVTLVHSVDKSDGKVTGVKVVGGNQDDKVKISSDYSLSRLHGFVLPKGTKPKDLPKP